MSLRRRMIMKNGKPDYFHQIRKIVRAGQAQSNFTLGQEFTCAKDDLTLTWRIVGFDHHVPANPLLTHSITLELKYVYSDSGGAYVALTFSAAQALYYCASALPAGTYNFDWTYSSGQLVSGLYQFTTTKNIPAGGQIVLGTSSTSTAITSCKVSTYSTIGGTTALESNITVSSGSSGTNLGTINSNSTSNANTNCASRILWGSGNYAQSAIRQFINSNGTPKNVWSPMTKFDRPPAWATSSNAKYRGLLNGLDPSFLDVVQPAVVACRTNNVFEVDSLNGDQFSTPQVYNLNDKFFLLSRPEVFGVYDSTSYKDGTQLEYYDGKTASQLIKYDVGGTARADCLRSPLPSGASHSYAISTAGASASGQSVQNRGITPSCIIA